MATIEEIWGRNDGPTTPPSPPMAVWCPACGAYLMTLGFEPEECDQCGHVFEQATQPRSE